MQFVYIGKTKSFYKKCLNKGDKVDIVTHDVKNKLVFIKKWGWFSDNLIKTVKS